MTQHPDTFPPVTTLSEIESRMGIPSLESLLHERDDLVEDVSTLRARHGPGGTYADLRKVLLATIAQKFRAQAVANGVKMTEAAVDDAAHSSEDYAAFVTAATQQRAEYAILENRISGIDEQIMRGNVVARYLSSEAMLAR